MEEDEILTELWRIKDELSAKANRVKKTEAQLMAVKQMEMDLRKNPYVFHPDAARRAFEIQNLLRNRALAIAYLKGAIEALDDMNVRVGALLTLSTVAEAYEDLTALAIEAGVVQEPYYQMLAGADIPRFNTKAEYLAWFDQQL